MCFLRRPQTSTKSSPLFWHLLHDVKSTIKSSSFFVAFLENTNFIAKYCNNNRWHYNRQTYIFSQIQSFFYTIVYWNFHKYLVKSECSFRKKFNPFAKVVVSQALQNQVETWSSQRTRPWKAFTNYVDKKRWVCKVRSF